MKVLFIYPPQKVLGLNLISPPVYSLGISYMASVLEREEIDVEILDAYAEELDYAKICDRVREIKPDVVGVTATTPTATSALLIAKLIKQRVSPDIRVALGGPHFSFLDELTLAQNSDIDFIIRGEGEYAFLDLIKSLGNGCCFSDIEGLTYQTEDRRVIRNKPRRQISHLDDLPFPAYHLLDMRRYGWLFKDPVSLNILTSSGCLGGCTFCSSYSFWDRAWRARSAESILAEIKMLVSRYNAKLISFGDECFTWAIDRVERLCDLLIGTDLGVSIFFQARVDHVIQMQRILPKLKRAGVIMIFMGIESASDTVLKSFNKQITIDETIKASKLLRENDILSWGSMVVGGPKDSPRVFKDNLKLIKRIDPDSMILQTYSIFPGTKDCSDEGMENVNWDIMDSVTNYSATESMRRRETIKWIRWLSAKVRARCSHHNIAEVVRERVLSAQRN